MNSPYGASPDEWATWDLVLGLGDDLLPVVCEPGLTIASSSKLTTYGKVPSRFDRAGHVVGFPGWTQHVSTPKELEAWPKDNRLGICLQTRHVRALDVDIENAEYAYNIWTLVGQTVGVLPRRVRPNSYKFLLLFELEGEYAKQILQTPKGAIEFLAGGNQALVAGHHPSGSRYAWAGGLPLSIPILSRSQFLSLQATLAKVVGAEWSEGRIKRVRDASALPVSVDDPVAEYLRTTRPDVLRVEHRDRMDVVCPWESDHTSQSDASATSYFFAGTGDFETGNFKCLHAHCVRRSVRDFLDAIGYLTAGFENLSESGHDVLGALTQSVDGFSGGMDIASPVAGPRLDRDKHGKAKARINNLLTWLTWLTDQGEGVSFDVFQDTVMLQTPAGRRPFTDADYTRLQARAERGMDGFAALSHQMVRQAVHTVAQDHCYDSAQEWIVGLPPWDGVSRIDTFCHRYLGASNTPYAQAVGRYIWTAMAGRILNPGIQADMAVILVSPQGTGKSTSIRTMAPNKDYYIDLCLSDRDADLARLTRGKTLVELSELRGLHTKEMEAIKAFVTRVDSEWVPKYFEMRTTYRRRFVMIGTTNNEEFLGDTTGERRWLPIIVGVQDVAAIASDHSQLWAEAVARYRTEGILWADAQRLAQQEHAEFTIHDVLEDEIAQWLERDEYGEKPGTREFIRLVDVMKDGLNFDSREMGRPNQMRVGDAMRRLGFVRIQKWVDGRNQKVWIRQPILLGGWGGTDDLL